MKREAGFTIFSVLIAMMLLMVGVTALSRTGYQVLSAHTAAAARTTALSIARSHLEDLRSRDPETLQTESPIVVDESGQLASAGPYTRTVVVDQLAINLKRVSVLVRGPRLQHPVQLVTLVFVSGT